MANKIDVISDSTLLEVVEQIEKQTELLSKNLIDGTNVITKHEVEVLIAKAVSDALTYRNISQQ